MNATTFSAIAASQTQSVVEVIGFISLLAEYIILKACNARNSVGSCRTEWVIVASKRG